VNKLTIVSSLKKGERRFFGGRAIGLSSAADYDPGVKVHYGPEVKVAAGLLSRLL
jgi:hypothetical protein